MSEFGGLWKHENNQHALVLPKTECGCPSGGGIENGHVRYPSYGGTQKEKRKVSIKLATAVGQVLRDLESLDFFISLDHLVFYLKGKS